MDKKRSAILEVGDVITPSELSRLTGKNETVIRRKCATGELPAARIGRNWYMPARAVLGPLIEAEADYEEKRKRARP